MLLPPSKGADAWCLCHCSLRCIAVVNLSSFYPLFPNRERALPFVSCCFHTERQVSIFFFFLNHFLCLLNVGLAYVPISLPFGNINRFIALSQISSITKLLSLYSTHLHKTYKGNKRRLSYSYRKNSLIWTQHLFDVSKVTGDAINKCNTSASKSRGLFRPSPNIGTPMACEHTHTHIHVVKQRFPPQTTNYTLFRS